MTTTPNTCQGFRCDANATDTRTQADGSPFECCTEHAEFFDAYHARTAGFSAAFLAEMAAESVAERELEGRVS